MALQSPALPTELPSGLDEEHVIGQQFIEHCARYRARGRECPVAVALPGSRTSSIALRAALSAVTDARASRRFRKGE